MRRVTEGSEQRTLDRLPYKSFFPKGLQTMKSGRRFEEDRRLLPCFGECKLVIARIEDTVEVH